MSFLKFFLLPLNSVFSIDNVSALILVLQNSILEESDLSELNLISINKAACLIFDLPLIVSIIFVEIGWYDSGLWKFCLTNSKIFLSVFSFLDGIYFNLFIKNKSISGKIFNQLNNIRQNLEKHKQNYLKN